MVANSIWVGGALALVMGVLGFAVAEPFGAAFSADAASRELTAIYIRWISLFTIVFAVGFVLGAGLRAAGDTRTPLLLGTITNVVNILFLYMLVYGGFGFPKIGIAGAALAGGLAFTVGTTFAVLLWRRGKLVIRAVPGAGVERTRVRALLQIGYPAALEQMVVPVGIHRVHADHRARSSAPRRSPRTASACRSCRCRSSSASGSRSRLPPSSASTWARATRIARPRAAGARCGSRSARCRCCR